MSEASLISEQTDTLQLWRTRGVCSLRPHKDLISTDGGDAAPGTLRDYNLTTEHAHRQRPPSDRCWADRCLLQRLLSALQKEKTVRSRFSKSPRRKYSEAGATSCHFSVQVHRMTVVTLFKGTVGELFSLLLKTRQ